MHAPAETATRKQRLNFYTEKPNDDQATEKIFVYFSDEKNVSIKTMRKYVSLFQTVMMNGLTFEHRFLEILDTQKITNGIIIFSEKMTPSARKACLHPYYHYRTVLTASIDYLRHVSRIYARRVRRSKSPGQHHASRFGSSTRSSHPR